jgi:hypothetical protein
MADNTTSSMMPTVVSTAARAVVGYLSMLGFPRNAPFAKHTPQQTRSMINMEKVISQGQTAYGACIADLYMFRERYGEESAEMFRKGMAADRPTEEVKNLNVCRGTMKEWWRNVIAYDAAFKVFAADEGTREEYKNKHDRYKQLAPIVELTRNEEDEAYIMGFKFPESN